MKNKYLILGIASICTTLLCTKVGKLRKFYINSKRRKNKSWKYYD